MFLSEVFKSINSIFRDYSGYKCIVRCINDDTDLNLDGSTQLKAGNIYTLVDIDLYSFHSWYYLKEFPGERFNSVRFERVDDE